MRILDVAVVIASISSVPLACGGDVDAANQHPLHEFDADGSDSAIHDASADTGLDASADTGLDGGTCGLGSGWYLGYSGAGCDGTNRACMQHETRDAICLNAWVCDCSGQSLQTCGDIGQQYAYGTACLIIPGPSVTPGCAGCPEHWSPPGIHARTCRSDTIGQHCAYGGPGGVAWDAACVALGTGTSEMVCGSDRVWYDVPPTKFEAGSDAPAD